MPQKFCRRNKVSCRCGKSNDLGTDWIRTFKSFALDRHCYATNITTTLAGGVSVRPQHLQPSTILQAVVNYPHRLFPVLFLPRKRRTLDGEGQR